MINISKFRIRSKLWVFWVVGATGDWAECHRNLIVSHCKVPCITLTGWAVATTKNHGRRRTTLIWYVFIWVTLTHLLNVHRDWILGGAFDNNFHSLCIFVSLCCKRRQKIRVLVIQHDLLRQLEVGVGSLVPLSKARGVRAHWARC